MFLRHEGYLGAIGAFLTHPRTRTHRGSFSENFSQVHRLKRGSITALGMLEQMPARLFVFPKLVQDFYSPDTFKLQSVVEQHYWINMLEESVINLFSSLKGGGDNQLDMTNAQVEENIIKFNDKFRGHLAALRHMPQEYGKFTVRALLDLKEQCLHEVGFKDLFYGIKQAEVHTSLQHYPVLIQELQKITNKNEKWRKLLENVMAGNMFDWGAKEIINIMESNELKFESCVKKINFDSSFNQMDLFIQNQHKPPRKCVIFVDNSGADIVLGVLPLARHFLELGTVVILAANTFPAINDVTVISLLKRLIVGWVGKCAELLEILHKVAQLDDFMNEKLQSQQLLVRATGSAGPCLDLKRIEEQLVQDCQDVDLVIIEGMGRSVLTNLKAQFTCDSVKVAVFKNELLAKTLGAKLFDAVCVYTPSNRSSSLASSSV